MYRSDVLLDADLDDVVRFLADEMVERLPDWNREFIEGHMDPLSAEKPSKKTWLVRVFYRTPPPLRDREYLYYLLCQRISDDETVIAYHSVDDPVPPKERFVRGVLFRTVHRCLRQPDGRTKVEHILATDIRGAVSQSLQSYLFVGGFVAANLRDASNQQRIFAAEVSS